MAFLTTERLLLRDWEERDIPFFYDMCTDPRVMEYFPGLWTLEMVQDFIIRMKLQLIEHAYTLWAVEELTTKSFIGFIGLNKPGWEADFTPCVEIGWRLAFSAWGKGYATEGASKVLEYAFNTLKINEILSFTIPENIKSRRVMERLGMHRIKEGDFLHPKVDPQSRCAHHVLYKIKKPDDALIITNH